MRTPQCPAADDGWLRPSHADRELVMEALKDAFVQGRLTGDELGTRTARALVARTCAELAALTADIPPVPAPAGSARPRLLARAAAGSGGCLALALAAFLVRSQLDRPGPSTYYFWSQLCLVVALFAVAVAPLIGTLAAATGHQRRSGGQPPYTGDQVSAERRL